MVASVVGQDGLGSLSRNGVLRHPGGQRAAARRPPLVPLLGLLTLCLIWGLSVPLTKLGLQVLPPLLLAALRYLSAAPFFVLFLIGRPLPSRRALVAMAALGVLGIDCGQVAQILGVQRTSASVATVISATIPILVVILAGWRLRQPLRAAHVAGLGVALTGIAVVAARGEILSFGIQPASALAGDALMLLSTVSVALYYVLSAELTQRYPVSTVAAWSSLFGVALLIPVVPWELRHAAISPGFVAIGVVVYLGVLVTVAGMWIWLHILRALPARVAAGTQYLQPLIGVAASAALFGDQLGDSFAIGTVLVFIGIALTSAYPRPTSPR
jgi:O-acetylserine/cysteine efflux transporter